MGIKKLLLALAVCAATVIPASAQFLDVGPSGSTLVPGQIPGTTTNNSATAGNVGEFPTPGTGTTPTLNSGGTPSNVASISLTAGDWDVRGATQFVDSGPPLTFGSINLGISQTTGTLPAATTTALVALAGGTSTVSTSPSLIVGPLRVSLSATTTIYLVASSVYSSGNLVATGQIEARRMR